MGPSGCGKTTILSCIVGRTRLDGGQISVAVNKRADIGYMPQVNRKLKVILSCIHSGRSK